MVDCLNRYLIKGQTDSTWGVEVESEMTARMMSRFPRTVTRYTDRNRLEENGLQFWVFTNQSHEKEF